MCARALRACVCVCCAWSVLLFFGGESIPAARQAVVVCTTLVAAPIQVWLGKKRFADIGQREQKTLNPASGNSARASACVAVNNQINFKSRLCGRRRRQRRRARKRAEKRTGGKGGREKGARAVSLGAVAKRGWGFSKKKGGLCVLCCVLAVCPHNR